MFVNNRTIFLTGRKNTLEEWPNSTLGSHCHNIFRKAKCTEVEALSWEGSSFCFSQLVFTNILYSDWNTHVVILKLKKPYHAFSC